MSEQGIAAWKLFPIVATLAVSIVGGFYLGGPGLGLAVGGLAAGTIVAMAIRNPPRPPIAPPLAHDGRRHVLVLLDDPLEVTAVESLTPFAGGGPRRVEVRLLSPSRHGFLARWTSDVAPGRHRAQRNLVLSSAALAAAGIDATARVGDEDPVQMVDDELRTFPAAEVVLVDSNRRRGAFGEGVGRELESRLLVPLRRVSAEQLPSAPSAARGGPVTSSRT